MNNKNVISFADFQNSKRSRELNNKYESLLGTLSLSEVCTEINSLLDELKTMMGLGKKEADQGKLILKELGDRATAPECSEQISLLLSNFEKQISSLER